MHWLNSVLLTIQVITSIAIIVLVLLQQGQGADMGSSFGAGSAGSLFGASGAANFLSRTTKWVAVIFFASTLGLAYVSHHTTNSILDGGIMQGFTQKPAAPVAPAPVAPTGSAVPSAPGSAAPAGASRPGTGTPSGTGSSEAGAGSSAGGSSSSAVVPPRVSVPSVSSSTGHDEGSGISATSGVGLHANGFGAPTGSAAGAQAPALSAEQSAAQAASSVPKAPVPQSGTKPASGAPVK
jgi:preprotein translocase subunit SecG